LQRFLKSLIKLLCSFGKLLGADFIRANASALKKALGARISAAATFLIDALATSQYSFHITMPCTTNSVPLFLGRGCRSYDERESYSCDRAEFSLFAC
tara:strand:- start:1729 stop:2022 length:294 start_codon:yes stop_codon:yes gene_type:complete